VTFQSGTDTRCTRYVTPGRLGGHNPSGARYTGNLEGMPEQEKVRYPHARSHDHEVPWQRLCRVDY
jgi:hypothetical protein